MEVPWGKAIVPAHDTPNFIANRVGTFAMLNTFRVMDKLGLTIEEIDALTGSAVGWPKTGTFRLADMVGIDVLANVARNFAATLRMKGRMSRLPPALDRMLEQKWLGDKAGQGFYKKGKAADGSETAATFSTWRPLSINPQPGRRLRSWKWRRITTRSPSESECWLAGDMKGNAAQFYWQTLPGLWAYAANRIGEVSDNLVEIDRAMKTGFNWELGPFEMWDAAGVASVAEKMNAAGFASPTAVTTLLASGGTSWYRENGKEYFDPFTKSYKPVEQARGIATLATASRGVVTKNAGASLIDIGDGIACIAFHSKMNSLGDDIVRFITQTLRQDSDAVRNFDGFIITSDATNFSVGANLMQLFAWCSGRRVG